MTFRKKLFIVFISIFAIVSTMAFSLFNNSKDDDNSFSLITEQKSYHSGDSIVLKFIAKNTSIPFLSLKTSYGSALLQPLKNNDTLFFRLPDFITKKTGVINWYLSEGKNSGSIEVIPGAKKTFLESYFGPRTILAGRNDFSMLIVVPTDSNDNPVEDSTSVAIKYQFQGYVTEREVPTNNFISWKNIFSRDLAGDILVSSSSNGTDSKELLTEVYPSNATDFTISVERNHPYADGNQISTFKTSVIKDQYGNIVADGTFVEFFIHTKNNTILKTSGSTLLGIATAKMLHPDSEDEWKVKAYVTGLAESDEINITYRPVMSDFNIKLSENGRTIKVGPLTSFMDQLMPDGAIVYLRIYDADHRLIELKKGTSSKGIVEFHLSRDFYPDGNYHFDLETSGLHKKVPNVHLW